MAEHSPKSYDVLLSPIYREKFEHVHSKFIDLIDKFTNQDYKPLGVSGYTHEQEKYLSLSMAIATNPYLLQLSHCSHRAVSACLIQEFKDNPPQEVIENTIRILYSSGKIGAFFVDDDSSYLLTHGFNNWFEQTGEDIPDDLHLDCKFIPGVPWEIERPYLKQLPDSLQLSSYEEVDNVCPKRLKGIECNIIHAEKSAIMTAQALRENFEMPPPTKSFLTSTWVPCLNCIGLVANHEVNFGTPLDVFSIYKAFEDPEDKYNALEIGDYLQRKSLGIYSGPYLAINKVPGYGWIPAIPEKQAVIQDRLFKTQEFLTNDPKLQLLINAWSINSE